MKKIISFKHDVSPLLTLAIPLAFTGLVQSAVWFFETIFLARLGAESLAAGSVVSWLFGVMAVILFGILSSINILIAHKHGEGDKEGITWIVRDGMLLALLLAVAATFVFWNIAPIFLLFGQSKAIVTLASSYLHALAWGLIANFIMLACFEVLIGIGRTRLVLIFSIIEVSLNIIASYILIFGKWGVPAFGIAGAGWGITVSYSISTVILVIFLICNKYYRFYFKNIFKRSKTSYLFELLQIGLPMGLMYCAEVAFFFVIILCMGLISSQAQAANQIALQYLGLFMSIMFAIAQAVTVRMGHLLGNQEVKAAEKVNSLGISIALIFMSLAAIIYWVFPNFLISIDFDIHNPGNANIIASIQSLLAVSAVFQIIEAVRIILFGSLRGLKDTQFTLLTSIISFWFIALPLGYFLAIPLNLGGKGFWLAMVASASISVVMLQWRFKKKIRYYKFIHENSK